MNKSFIPMAHQVSFAEFWGKHGRVLNLDGCGTGKTLSCIHSVNTNWPTARVLVLAPLSILEVAWLSDLAIGAPRARVGICAGTKARKVKVLEDKTYNWVISNHDTVKLIAENDYEHQFDVLIVDEGDFFRNSTTQRAKHIQKIAYHIPMMTLMTGTPTPNSVTEIWHLAYLVDNGQRLGKNFHAFRHTVCDSEPIYGAPPGAVNWIDKPAAENFVVDRLSDITTRLTLDDVTELPETIYRDVSVKLPQKLRDMYRFLKDESILELENGELINAVSAGVRAQKMLQLLCGGVYNEEGEVRDIHPDRHQLVIDLAAEADGCLVAFNWKHQRDSLIKAAKKRKLSYGVIDGETPAPERTRVVEKFQNGELDVVFAHPQSAGHGITLTRATRVIWSSPTYRADLYQQFNHRIVRKGQKRKHDIIHIAAFDTAEERVYEVLNGKNERMGSLLRLLVDDSRAA